MDFHDLQSVDEKSDETVDTQNSKQSREQLEGSHIAATEIETKESTAAAEEDTIHSSTSPNIMRTPKHVSFVAVEETSTELPAASKIIENVKEYVRQIEQQTEIVEEQRREESKILTKRPQLQQKIVFELNEFPRLKLFEEQKLPTPSLPTATYLPLAEQQQQQQQKLPLPESALQVALVDCDHDQAEDKTVFKDVQNQEIADRFKQIMEMFDNFTKNLESLEMPALKEPSTSVSPKTMGKKGDDFWKSDTTAEASSTSTSSSSSLLSVKAVEPQVHASNYAQYFQDLGATAGESTTEEIIEALPPAVHQKSATTKVETVIDMPMPQDAKDTATTMATCHLLRSDMYTFSGNNACQIRTPGNDDEYAGITILPCVRSRSSFSASRTSHTDMMTKYTNDSKVQTFTFDLEEAAEAIAKNTNNNTNNKITATTTKTITTVTISPTTASSGNECKAKKITPDNSGLTVVKVTESPSATELAPLTGAIAATAHSTPGSVPCERTFHTIHIEATSSPSSSIMRRPPLCLRMWNVITDLCAAACLCIQVNKDCLFCFGFFIAFVVSASFLTAFFYRTLSISPQLFQYSQPVELHHRDVVVQPDGKKDMLFNL